MIPIKKVYVNPSKENDTWFAAKKWNMVPSEKHVHGTRQKKKNVHGSQEENVHDSQQKNVTLSKDAHHQSTHEELRYIVRLGHQFRNTWQKGGHAEFDRRGDTSDGKRSQSRQRFQQFGA